MNRYSTTVESALQPINEDLGRMIAVHRERANNEQIKEQDILRILTLMARIRTKALENGWDQQCEADLGEAQSILRTATTTI
jgi:hypothetical protein